MHRSGLAGRRIIAQLTGAIAAGTGRRASAMGGKQGTFDNGQKAGHRPACITPFRHRSVRDHPGSRTGQRFRPVRAVQRAAGLLLAARTASASGAVAAQTLGAVGAAFVGGKGGAAARVHLGQPRCGQQHPGRACRAGGAIAGIGKSRHRGKRLEGAALRAGVIIDGHGAFLPFRGGWGRAIPRAARLHHRSWAMGMSTEPSTSRVGPSTEGINAEPFSKMSVGSHSVAQAFGTSTTPEICPCTGAVPRIE